MLSILGFQLSVGNLDAFRYPYLEAACISMIALQVRYLEGSKCEPTTDSQ